MESIENLLVKKWIGGTVFGVLVGASSMVIFYEYLIK